MTRALVHARSAIVSCQDCARLREYCERVAREKKRAYRDDTYWGKPVPGFGDPRARILILGLAPAAHGANRTGRVFTGDGVGGSGDFLMAALHRAGYANLATSQHPDDGLRLRDVYIAAAVRCAPPGNRPLPDEIATCARHLDAEVAALPRLQIVVALGQIAWHAWLDHLTRAGHTLRPRPLFGHGAVLHVRIDERTPPTRTARTSTAHRTTAPPPAFAHDASELRRGRAVAAFGGGGGHLRTARFMIGCYHPSRQNTNTGRVTAAMYDAVFQGVRRLAGSGT